MHNHLLSDIIVIIFSQSFYMSPMWLCPQMLLQPGILQLRSIIMWHQYNEVFIPSEGNDFWQRVGMIMEATMKVI